MVMSVEYRIPLPLTVDEYRIAQLYMLAKKSRQESHGEGSGVEILVNEPYTDGPGPDGKGQYTHKVYHVGSHLPGWLKSLIPKSALSVEEEAWNAYPYTKTRFTCPFVEKFNIEVETYYFNDGGQQENVFNLSKSDMKQREIDLIDVVKDQLYGADYLEDEDPRKYISQKTSRGPLTDNWIEDYSDMCKGKNTPLDNGEAIMCAYKLCKVEFRYWGMQTKIEKFIHDIALRKTMLRAHRQAWAWMDEWWGLTIEDIRNIENETQTMLAKKYGQGSEDVEDGAQDPAGAEVSSGVPHSPSVSSDRTPNLEQLSKCGSFRTSTGSHSKSVASSAQKNETVFKVNLNYTILEFPPTANFRMESIRRDSDSSGSEEEFFDCQVSVWGCCSSAALCHEPPLCVGIDDTSHPAQTLRRSAIPIIKGMYRGAPRRAPHSACFALGEDLEETVALHKWSSLELLPPDGDTQNTPGHSGNEDSIFSPAFISRVAAERHSRVLGRSMETSAPSSPSHSPSHQPGPCSTTVLLLVVHAGSVLDPTPDVTNKRSDVTTFRGAFESVMRQHYPHMVGHVAIRLISAPPVCSDSLNILSRQVHSFSMEKNKNIKAYSLLSPYGLDATPVCGEVCGGDSVPVGAVPLLATSVPEYDECVVRTLNATNAAYHEFLRSEEGHGFNGQVCIIGDSIGGVLAYDVLCRVHDHPKYGSNSNIPEGEPPSPGQYYKQKSSPAQPQSSSPSPATPPSVSPDKPLSSPPLTTLSPTITVSLESALTKPTSAVFVQALESSSSQSPNTATSSHSPSDKIPSPQSANIPHSPMRKISAPLPTPSGFYQPTRKCSAPCSIPGGAAMWGYRPGSNTPTPSPPGPTSSSSSSTSPSGVCHSHHFLCQCHNPLHRPHHHQGVSCARDSLIPGPVGERRGKNVCSCSVMARPGQAVTLFLTGSRVWHQAVGSSIEARQQHGGSLCGAWQASEIVMEMLQNRERLMVTGECWLPGNVGLLSAVACFDKLPKLGLSLAQAAFDENGLKLFTMWTLDHQTLGRPKHMERGPEEETRILGTGQATHDSVTGDEIGENAKVYRKSVSSDGPHHSDVPHSRCASDSDYHYARHLSAPFPRRRSSSSSDHAHSKLDFEVSDLFMFGCPLALVLVYRKMVNTSDKNSTVQRPACQQVHNLFHPTDPLAVRVEPLISARFSLLPPITIPRYTKYPLGDGLPTHLRK
ncbi:Protein retinal degeneration B [Chionoecetes opilio]|uniref:Protein retinal degeneration B n=1 Tax=Chionoecetes opilio TaxID=41210 RepID=A0A8J4XYL6_CHIOP|nr:Protein retinal degeneration B [Chionoecetes opilio]